MSLVRTAVDGDGVAVVTLADPDRRNALGAELTVALAGAVATVLDAGARAIVLAAEPPVFCAGGSVDDLFEPRLALRDTYAGYLAVASAPVPTIAAVDGPCVGAGVNLPLACDVVLCSPAARFDPRFLDLGIHPGGGHLWRMARRVGRQGAAAMTLCGDVLAGDEAVVVGMAWRCVASDELMPRALDLARRAASRPPELVRTAKAMLAQSLGTTDVSDAFELELAAQAVSMESDAFKERLVALREKLGR